MVTDPSVRFKHAFVTGATGIVGAPLCARLSAKGIRVTAYSRTPGDSELPPDVTQVLGDILDPEALRASAGDADLIFHVAAAVHNSASTLAGFERVNVSGTANIVEVAREIGAKLVHVSTVNVEGFHRGELADDYARTKAAAEDLVHAAVEDGLDAAIVRPAAVFGNEPGRSGIIVDRILSGSLKILPAPSRKMSGVWSSDLANALINAAVLGEAGSTHTIAGPTMTTGEFVSSVARSAGVKRPLLSIPAWMFAVPLQLAWWGKGVTRWTPPFSVESLLNGSVHDGAPAAVELDFKYTPIAEIFNTAD
jgi:dihydroflavonol-4-reductase